MSTRTDRALMLVLLGVGAASCVSPASLLSGMRESLPRPMRTDVRWQAMSPSAGADTDRRVRRLLSRPLDAETAGRLALLHNPSVQAALDELGIARGQLVSASLLPNVSIDADIWFPVDDNDEISLEGAARIDLGSIIRIPLQRSVAEAELRATSFEAATRVLDLAFDARVAFHRYQAAVQIQALLGTVVEAQRAAWDAARLLREAGNVRELDVVQQRVLYEESRLALANAELEVLDARERLNVLMGVWGEDTQWDAAPRLPAPPEQAPDLERLERRAVEASLTLASLGQRAEARARRIGVAQSLAVLPQLRAGAGVNREEGALGVGPSFEITLPLFDQQQGTIASEEARLEQVRARHTAEAIRVRSSVRRARNALLNALMRVNFYHETLLPVRAELVAQMLLQYNAMQVDVFQLLNARRAQIEANVASVEALRDYWIADAVLAKILAGGSADVPAPSSFALPRLSDAGAGASVME